MNILKCASPPRECAHDPGRGREGREGLSRPASAPLSTAWRSVHPPAVIGSSARASAGGARYASVRSHISKKCACSALIASTPRASGTTSEMLTLLAPCESISTWMPCSLITEKTCAITLDDFSTLAISVMIVCPSEVCTSAKADSSRTSASSAVASGASLRSLRGSARLRLSVSETLTSEEAIVSTEMACFAKASKVRARKPCAPSMRVEVMSTICTPVFEVIAVTSHRVALPACVISVPAADGLYEFFTRTGMFTRRAGCIATGWSTCAPK
mmetsp:Transcript_28743/g.71630  ORF Transcript_28743/g.71630 Transcript_28743/m.71630 type:complete len:273 (+) Transcript_28743:106-924(+)